MLIYDEAVYSGADTEKLLDVLKDVYDSTKTLELKARDLKVMSLTGYDPATGAYAFQTFFMTWDKKNGRFAPEHMGDTLTRTELRALGADETIEEELRSKSRTMIDIGGEKFFMNPNFLKTYMQRGGSNPGDFAKSLDIYCRINRDFGVISFLAATNPELKMTLLYRENLKTHGRKAFALFSESGTYVPQMNFFVAMSKEFRKNYGEVAVKDYTVCQEKTAVYSEFPEEGKAYASRFPKIPDECVPGFSFQTSDIGLGSILVEGTMRLGDGAYFILPKSEATHPHKGYVATKSVVDDCRKKIIHADDPDACAYVKTAKRLSGLTEIRLPSGKIPDIVKTVLVKSGLAKTLGSKRSARMVSEILSELGKKEDEGFTAYDVALAFLKFSGKYEQELRDADTVVRLHREFAGVVFFGYEKHAA